MIGQIFFFKRMYVIFFYIIECVFITILYLVIVYMIGQIFFKRMLIFSAQKILNKRSRFLIVCVHHNTIFGNRLYDWSDFF